jgi:heat shock protein HslJ
MKQLILLATVITIALGCTPKIMHTPVQNHPNASFDNTRWKLVILAGGITIPPMADVFIRFAADQNQAAGNSGCNKFTGKYNRDGNNLQAGPFAVTRMMCPPEQMAVENAFLGALQKADSFVINGDHLKLMKGKEILAEFDALYL